MRLTTSLRFFSISTIDALEMPAAEKILKHSAGDVVSYSER